MDEYLTALLEKALTCNKLSKSSSLSVSVLLKSDAELTVRIQGVTDDGDKWTSGIAVQGNMLDDSITTVSAKSIYDLQSSEITS
jgi:hypothetical protein